MGLVFRHFDCISKHAFYFRDSGCVFSSGECSHWHEIAEHLRIGPDRSREAWHVGTSSLDIAKPSTRWEAPIFNRSPPENHRGLQTQVVNDKTSGKIPRWI
jgi:hypothetical protein